ncbi:YidB family protein [Methylosarcina fibrata]|uniref:YidB family protein n=1 Tax=Methylosarcina fibrata TaxID=105972 RepID=UPI00036FDA01|nr:YidB family protein [Methylosarcina fibrata]
MSSFLDLVKSAISSNTSASGQAESQSQNLVNGALQMLDSMGGINGLVNKFQQSGLGDAAKSWISTGDNKNVSPDQLANALGKDQIAAVAQKAGIPESEAPSVLARVLPEMVDKLTPEGKEPESGNLSTWSKVLLGGLGVAAAGAAGAAAASYFGSKEEEEKPSTFQPTAASAGEQASETPAGRTYTVVSGDTLSGIAKQFYHDANQWQRIFDANRDVLSNPDRISPGQHLRIP